MLKRLCFIFLIFSFLFSCSSLKKRNLWQQGRIVDLSEKQTFPFEREWGMIFLEVKINGQPFNFLLDTGAPNVLDKKTVEKLGIPYKSFGSVGDAYGRREKLSFTNTASFDIGPLHFEEVAALIADFRSVQIFDCMDIDGLIGSNLMRKAVWQFDFEKEEITVAPSIKDFDVSQADTLPIYPSSQGTPRINFSLGSKEYFGVKVDFGSGNGLTTPIELVPEKQINDAGIITVGEVGTGLYGGQKDTVRYVYSDSIKLGETLISPGILRVRPKTGGLVGLNFWENYLVTIDWKNKRLYYELNEDSPKMKQNTFGFGLELKKSQVLINSLTSPSPASEAGIQLGDQVLEFNGEKVEDIPYCGFLELLQDTDEVQFKLKRGEKILDLKVLRSDIFKLIYQAQK
ncbi:MAG: aspartyl protease family protein [Bacteroidota bacterium]